MIRHDATSHFDRHQHYFYKNLKASYNVDQNQQSPTRPVQIGATRRNKLPSLVPKIVDLFLIAQSWLRPHRRTTNQSSSTFWSRIIQETHCRHCRPNKEIICNWSLEVQEWQQDSSRAFVEPYVTQKSGKNIWRILKSRYGGDDAGRKMYIVEK